MKGVPRKRHLAGKILTGGSREKPEQQVEYIIEVLYSMAAIMGRKFTVLGDPQFESHVPAMENTHCIRLRGMFEPIKL